MKKRTIPTLLLVLTLTLSLAACGKDTPVISDDPGSGEPDTIVTEPVELKPMVVVNGTLYYSTGRESDITARCGVMDGEIDKSVDSTAVPTEEGQSNFGTGYGYQWVSETEIDVCMEGKWMRFECSDASASFADNVERFACQTGAELLSGRENGCYSPISLYLALSMAATGAAGETQKQMYTLLGAADTDTLAQNCADLYKALQRDEEYSKLYLANSVWTRNDIAPKADYADRLKDSFYAEQFSVPFDAKTNRKMTQWVKDNTKGLLSPAFDHDDNTMEVLLNTIYFKDAWLEPFFESATTSDSFTTADGTECSAEFMHTATVGSACVCADYARASLPFMSGGEMEFILPAEGETVDSLMSTYGLQRLLGSDAQSRIEKPPYQSYEIRWSVPKFKMGGERDLIPMLKTLGITDAFDEKKADFSAASEIASYISAVRQGTYFSVDETGVEAAAFTEIAKDECTSIGPDQSLEMNLNRPFLYAVRSGDGTLLFVGVCANPTELEVCGYPTANS